MTINKTLNEKELVIEIEGRLDTTTAPELENELKSSLDGIEILIMNLEKLEYISSAGIRVILTTQKTMSKQGKLIIKNVNESIMEVFDITGMTYLLTIE